MVHEEDEDEDDGDALQQVTCGQLVRHYLPLARERDVMFILWELTPYPCWHPQAALEHLASVCAPVRKRGWYRKLLREYQRIQDEMLGEPPSTNAVDPQGGSTHV